MGVVVVIGGIVSYIISHKSHLSAIR